jgi:DNA-binding XRE family transcriptional regulator
MSQNGAVIGIDIGKNSFHVVRVMTKTFVGPQLRQLRRERHQTRAEMAKVLGINRL